MLLASSLMGILSIIFLNNLISYTDDMYGYYKSYYVAKAGLELALTEINSSDVWFYHLLTSENAINTNNFDCVGCHFKSVVKWRNSVLSDYFWVNNECNEDTALSLLPWQSMTLPMFYDKSSDFSTIFSDDENFEILYNDGGNLIFKWINVGMVENLNMGVIFQEMWWGTNLDYLYMTWITACSNLFKEYFRAFESYYTDVYSLIWNKKYLPYIVLSNPSNNQNEIKFCIVDEKWKEWPTTKYFISSIWEYMGKTVWLQAIYAQPVPSFLINPYIGGSTMSVSENYYDF